jgi:hypothetical protein
MSAVSITNFPPLLLPVLHRSKRNIEVSALATILGQLTVFGLNRKLMG